MSIEITTIPRIAKVPIVDHFVQLIKARIAEAQAKAEELRVRAKLPELKLPQLPELPPLPEKLLSLQEQGKALFELVQAQVTEKAIPVITTIDAFGNSRLDLAEKKFQFIFTASAEEIIQAAEDRRLEVVEKVQTTFEEKIKTPLIAFGEDLDQRSEPFLKYAVDHFPIEVPQTEAQYNYQRALLLSKALGDKGVTYSTEQLRHLEEKSTFVARVAEKAKITAATVKEKVDELPPFPRTLEEAKELSTTIIDNVKERIQSIPPPPPELKELFDKVPAIFSELVELVKDSEIPLSEKPVRIGKHVVERVEPEVEALKGRGLELFEEVKGRIGALRA